MALTPSILYSALIAARLSGALPFAGVSYDKLALGVAQAVSVWGVSQPANLGLSGLATGMSGVGAVAAPTSKVAVPPNAAPLQAALNGAGMLGVLPPSLATVIANGLSTAFTASAQYTGVAVGVGVGADVSKVTVANPATLVAALSTALSATLGPGQNIPRLALGLGNGIAGLLLLGTGAGAVVGTTTVPPVPASGPTTCVVI